MAKKQKCIICGCTEDQACFGGCTWVKKNLCSNEDCVKKYKEAMIKRYNDYNEQIEKEEKANTKCFAEKYTRSVLISVGHLHGSIVCTGYDGQPVCKHVKKCLEQFKGIIKDRNYNIIDRWLDNQIKKHGQAK